ncbi:MAG: conjugative transposon protein TraM [Prevotella pectinovora]
MNLNLNLKKLKKVNFRQPKYIFPPVIILPLLGVIYYLMATFSGKGKTEAGGIVTDSINMTLPDARGAQMEGKMAVMNKRFSEGGAFTAVGALGDEVEEKDTTTSGYNASEWSKIEAENAARERERKAQEELLKSQQENMRRINGYTGYGGRSRQDDLNDYARELERIQNQSMERQRKYMAEQERRDKAEEAEERQRQQEMIDALTGNTRRKSNKKEVKAEVVEKVKEDNYERFNTVATSETVDAPLIRAMIDRTTKAREGTRLRFKLLDDVTVKGIRLKKGSYLYGVVSGFGQQRVKANITSILVGGKFIKVGLSVFDNDGMEGFYVPESTFREMVKDAGSAVAGQQLQFDTGSSSGISPEIIALQALQNMYQSASSAVSNNIRKNKARIKYNTIVYLVNTQQE